MGGRNGITDPRFVIQHAGDPEYSLITRSSDGQLLFLANMLSKMKDDTPLGSRILIGGELIIGVGFCREGKPIDIKDGGIKV